VGRCDLLANFGNPSKFQRVSLLGFVTAPTWLNGGQPNFARCLAVSCNGILYIYFWELLHPNGILPSAKFTVRPSLAFFYIGSVTAQHSSTGVSQSLRRGTSLKGMELRNFRRGRHIQSHIIFDRAAITLGIGPHSTYDRDALQMWTLYFRPLVSFFFLLLSFFLA